MKKYSGAEKGPNGVYLNLSSGEFVQINEQVQLLPGASEDKYLKVPPPLAVIAGPFLGLAFIIFLPFAGVAGFIGFVGYRLWRGAIAVQRRTLQLAFGSRKR